MSIWIEERDAEDERRPDQVRRDHDLLAANRSTKTPARRPTKRLGIAVAMSISPTASADSVLSEDEDAGGEVGQRRADRRDELGRSRGSGSRACGRPRTSTGRAGRCDRLGLLVGHRRTPSDVVQRAMGALLHSPSAPLARRSVPAAMSGPRDGRVSRAAAGCRRPRGAAARASAGGAARAIRTSRRRSRRATRRRR